MLNQPSLWSHEQNRTLQTHTAAARTRQPGQTLEGPQYFLESLRITFWSRQIPAPAVSNEGSSTTNAKLKTFSLPSGVKLILPLHQCSHAHYVPVNPSQNHRTLWVGRDLWRPSSPSPLQWAGTASAGSGCWEPRPTWPGMFPGMGHRPPLWAACARVSPPHCKKCLPYS